MEGREAMDPIITTIPTTINTIPAIPHIMLQPNQAPAALQALPHVTISSPPVVAERFIELLGFAHLRIFSSALHILLSVAYAKTDAGIIRRSSAYKQRLFGKPENNLIACFPKSGMQQQK